MPTRHSSDHSSTSPDWKSKTVPLSIQGSIVHYIESCRLITPVDVTGAIECRWLRLSSHAHHAADRWRPGELVLFGQQCGNARENLGGIRSRLSRLQADQSVDALEVGGDLSGLATARRCVCSHRCGRATIRRCQRPASWERQRCGRYSARRRSRSACRGTFRTGPGLRR